MSDHFDSSASDAGDRQAVWTVAASLTAGLLGNPSKGHFSVKDAISLFDEVLQELTAYARVRGDFAAYAAERGHSTQRESTADVAPAAPAAAVHRRPPVPIPQPLPVPPPGANQPGGPQQPRPPGMA